MAAANFSVSTFHFSLFLVPLQSESSATVCRRCQPPLFGEGRAREESPGSTGRSTGENASSWRQLDMEEENDR